MPGTDVVARHLKILLVEDDEDDYVLTRDLCAEVRRDRYDLEWVASFELARARLAARAHDVYLVDCRLGAHSGLDLLREAIAAGCPAPIILLTGLGDRSLDVEAMASGAADYLVKGQINAPLLERSISHSLQRKLDERKLRESEEQYRLLFDCNPHPMWVADRLSLAFLAVNDAAIRLYGYTRAEFLAMSLKDLSPPMERESWGGQAEPDVLPARNVGLPVIWSHAKKNGEVITVEITWNELAFQGTTAAMVLANDISLRLGLEAHLRQAQKLDSLGTLAGGVAHDFNNLLNIIAGYATRLQQSQPEHPKTQQTAEAIQKAVHRGAGLVRQILTFARKADVILQPVQLNSLAEELASLLAETFPRAITLNLRLAPDLPLITADPNQLHQAILNLCVNARDAMGQSGSLTISTSRVPAAEVRHRWPSAEDTDHACISVADTGHGMDELTRSKIFEPFFTTKARDRGTGLGLAVVYGVVQSHRGLIDVRSAVGAGSVFHLYLPIRDTEFGTPEASAEATQRVAGGSETILVVEDEELLLTLMQSMLEEKGYRVLSARDGVEGIQTYGRHRETIDLVVADMDMPRMGGWELLLRLQQIDKNVVCILTSGYVSPGLRQQISLVGVRDFIDKPYSSVDMLSRIRRVLDTAKAGKTSP